MIRVYLTERQRQALELRARHELGRLSKRLRFILLSARGHSPPQIGQMLGFSAATVRYWLKRYLSEGVLGLYDRPRSGRPRRKGPKEADAQE